MFVQSIACASGSISREGKRRDGFSPCPRLRRRKVVCWITGYLSCGSEKCQSLPDWLTICNRFSRNVREKQRESGGRGTIYYPCICMAAAITRHGWQGMVMGEPAMGWRFSFPVKGPSLAGLGFDTENGCLIIGHTFGNTFAAAQIHVVETASPRLARWGDCFLSGGMATDRVKNGFVLPRLPGAGAIGQ